MREWLARSLCALLAACVAGSAAAGTVTFEFEGVLLRGPEFGGFDDSVVPGAVLRGAYTLDLTPTVSEFYTAYEVVSIAFDVGNYRFIGTVRDPTMFCEPSIGFSCDPPFHRVLLSPVSSGTLYLLRSDYYLASNPPDAEPVGPLYYQLEWWNFLEGPGPISPGSPPRLDPDNYFELWGGGGHEPVGLFAARVTRIVPEPTTVALLALALGLLALRARGRTSRVA